MAGSASKLFMSVVTDDVLWEILVRLPHARYVIRCSLVSKRWHSLIHHPQFIAEFFRQNLRRMDGNNFELFFRMGGGALPDPPVYRLYCEKESNRLYPNWGSTQHWPELKVSSSSLDLMVFKNRIKKEIHVCNPLTSQSQKIPGPIPYQRRFGLGIVTDLENFGHYKVAVLNKDAFDDPMLNIRVFCSRTGVWTHSRFSVPSTVFVINNAISSQGVLYFPLAADESSIGVMVCSLLESSRFCFVQMPVDGFYERGRTSVAKVFFGVVSGRLRVSQLLKREKIFSLKIWELRYDNESEFESDYSWVLVHDVSLRSGNSDKTKLIVVAFHPYNGDVIFVSRDCINICRYHDIRGDKYEIVGQLPISNPEVSKKFFTHYISTFTLVHTSWPTPLGYKVG